MTKHIAGRRRIVEVVVSVTCDLCGDIIKEPEPEGACIPTRDATVRASRGESWPCDSSGDHVELDLCDPCMDRLLEWVKSEGGTVEWRSFG